MKGLREVVVFQFDHFLLKARAGDQFVELLLEGRWVKATPAFNLSLCTKFRVRPLEFDGLADSIFHPFDEDNRRHMEYVHDRGSYADVPAEEIKRVFRETYPNYYNLGPDARRETFAPA